MSTPLDDLILELAALALADHPTLADRCGELAASIHDEVECWITAELEETEEAEGE